MKKQIDMVNGNLLSGMFRFAMPLVLCSVLQVLYNSADTFIVGMYDDPLSMGAVSSAGGVLACVVNLFIGIAVGVNILAARFFGAGDMKTVRKYGGTGIVLGGIFGVLICVLGQIFAKPLVEIIGIAPEIRDRTITYMRIYLFGVPFSALFNFISAFLRGTGDTKSPTRSLVISGAVNVVFNIIFVKELKLGVTGVATATAISMFVSFFLAFCAFVKSPVGVKTKEIRFDMTICRNIIKVGLPTGFQSLFATVSNVFTTSAMNGFGAAAISGEAIEIQMESLLCVGISGICSAVVTFVSQNVGAGNYKRLGEIFRKGFFVAAVYCIVGTVIAYSTRVPFVEMFAHGNEEVAMFAYKKFNFIILPFVTVAIKEIPGSMLQGIGETFLAMLVSVFTCLFRIAWIVFLLPIPIFHSVEFLFVSYPIVWTMGGIIYFAIYQHRKKRLFRNV